MKSLKSTPKQITLSWLFRQDFGQAGAGSSRCDLKSNLVAAGCAPAALESPTSKLQVIEDRPLSNKAAGATQDVTQIKPQKLHITLRPGGLQSQLGVPALVLKTRSLIMK